MKNKRGFTLAEMLITLAIIGIAAALLIRSLARVFPNQEKALFLKAYHAVEEAVSQIINDPNKYDLEEGAEEAADFGSLPLKQSRTVNIKGKTYTITNIRSALCFFLAEKFDIVGDPKCTIKSSRGTPNFTTSNGMVWYGINTDNGEPYAAVQVDVNGDKPGGEYTIQIFQDGKVDVFWQNNDKTETTERKWLKNQTDFVQDVQNKQ